MKRVLGDYTVIAICRIVAVLAVLVFVFCLIVPIPLAEDEG